MIDKSKRISWQTIKSQKVYFVKYMLTNLAELDMSWYDESVDNTFAYAEIIQFLTQCMNMGHERIKETNNEPVHIKLSQVSTYAIEKIISLRSWLFLKT